MGAKVHQLLEVLEELLADVANLCAGREDALLHEDQQSRLEAWAKNLWPVGLNQCAKAIDDARLDLARNVSGRLVVEALVSRFQFDL